ncbi:MAG: alcohol dehydrogenase, partial [Deltaproteobacteria bacterium]
MTALRFDGQVRMVQVPRPQPARSEALIRVQLVGICQTD